MTHASLDVDAPGRRPALWRLLILVTVALCSLSTAWADDPAPGAEPIDWWPWPKPALEQVVAQAAEVDRVDGTCRAQPSLDCAVQQSEARGALAALLARRGEPDGVEQALAPLLEVQPGPSPEAVSRWAADLGKVASDLEEVEFYRHALTLRLRALALLDSREPGPSRELFDAVLLAGEDALQMTFYEQALALGDRAVAMVHELGLVESVEEARANLVVAGSLNPSVPRGRAALDRALAVYTHVLGPEHPSTLLVLLRFQVVYQALRDAAGVAFYREKILSIVQHHDIDQITQAGLYLGVAGALVGSGQLEAGTEYLQRAAGLFESSPRAQPLLLADVYHVLGAASGEMAHTLGAIAFNQVALSLAFRSVGPVHRTFTQTLSNQAHLLSGQQRHEEAIAAARAAMQGKIEAQGPSDWIVGTAYRTLAQAEAHAGREEDARGDIRKAFAIHTGEGLPAIASLAEREALTWVKRNRMSLDSELAMLRRPEDALLLWEDVIIWTGAIREAASQRHDARLEDNQYERNRSALEKIRAELAALVAEAGREPNADDLSRIQDKTLERDRLERAVASNPASALPSRPRPGLEEICASLEPDSALVQLVRYPHLDSFAQSPLSQPVLRYTAFLVRAGQCNDPQRVDLGPAAPIDAAVQTWRADLDSARERGGLRSSGALHGARLRALAWDPLTEALGDTARVYLVPDGELALVPFGMLPDASGGYLLEHIGFSYLDTARDLARERTGPLLASGSAAAVLGGLRYGPLEQLSAGPVSTVRQAATCGGRFAPLPASRRERRLVSGRLRALGLEIRPLQGDAVDEQAVASAAEGARVVHLATHGFYPDAGCREDLQGLVPLSMVGLALSGANRPFDASQGSADGLLSAEEIAGLDLRDAALVVLSSCGSGLGQVQTGEGAQGLRRAFAIAGARSQITTLAAVPDRASSRLMTRLYAGLGAGLSPAEALLRAQREALAAQRAAGRVRPETWGAFVSTGTWTLGEPSRDVPGEVSATSPPAQR